MKVTIDGITYEGSEDEIERVVQRHAPLLPSQTSRSSGTQAPESPYEVTA